MKKTLIGTVVSTKMSKTIVVEIERKFQHRTYKKVITRHKRYKVHNNDVDLKVGDLVKIRETKPISKDKFFIAVEKVNVKI